MTQIITIIALLNFFSLVQIWRRFRAQAIYEFILTITPYRLNDFLVGSEGSMIKNKINFFTSGTGKSFLNFFQKSSSQVSDLKFSEFALDK